MTEFEKYLKEARQEFRKELNKYNVSDNLQLRTACDSFMIAFDQATMYNKERVKRIVSEWFEFKAGIILSNETLSKLVDDITETKQCDIPFVSVSLPLTKQLKKQKTVK